MRERLMVEGSGAAVLLEGAAGVGKTALLEVAVDRARGAGIRAFRLSGVESEVMLPYSGLHQLLFDMQDGFEGLPGAHRDVLHRVLGHAGPGAAPERFAVSIAVLEALRRMAAHGRVLVVVDDVQWIDPASADILGFVARRLQGIPVDLLAAGREAGASALGHLARRRIEALDEDSAAALLDAAYPGLAPQTCARLLAEAAGNPLALLELPKLLSPDQLAGRAPLPASLPVDGRMEALFAPRLRELPPDSLDLLLIAALEETGDLRTIWATYKGSWEAADAALGPAEELGLVRVDTRTGQLGFRHPLVRSAVVSAARPRERRAAHRALAQALDREPERRIGHLVAASLGPDEALAQELEEAGHTAFRRGSGAAALNALRRSAELSPQAEDRDRRLAHAAFAAAQSGALDVAAELVGDAYWEQASVEDTARAATSMVYRLLEPDGNAEAAHRLLIRVIDGLSGTGQVAAGGSWLPRHGGDEVRVKELVGELQFLLALVAYYTRRMDLWPEVLAHAEDAPEYVRLCCVSLDSAAERAPEIHRRIRAEFAALPPDVAPRRISQLSMISIYFDEASRYRDWWLKIAQRSQEGGTFIHWSYGTILLGHDAFFSGRWDEAEAMAREGHALAEELGYHLSAFRLLSQLATVAAGRGDAETVAVITRRLLEWSEPRRLGLLEVSAWQARALLALGRQEYETAYRCLERVSPPGTIPRLNPRAIWSFYDLVEAAVHTGRTAQARVHAAMARRAELAELSPRLAMLVHAAGALAGPKEAAGERFRAALATAAPHQAPFDHARVELAYAQWLWTHAGDADAAREHLAASLQAFDALGARVWAARARAELTALGTSVATGREAPCDNGPLTPQERQIAELAATGLSNKEIGTLLSISPRTVGSHLYKIFPKLGIRTRASLRDALKTLTKAPDHNTRPSSDGP